MKKIKESKTLQKLEENLTKFMQVKPGEYSYSELCKELEEEELPQTSKKRKTQSKRWKQFMDIKYDPKTDKWIVNEIYEEKMLDNISSSQYYEKMCYILYLHMFTQKYATNNKIFEEPYPQVVLGGNELCKLLGLVNNHFGKRKEYLDPLNKSENELIDLSSRFPMCYDDFMTNVSIYARNIVNNCLQSLRNKRLINYYIKYEMKRSDIPKRITLSETQVNLLTEIEREVLDELYNEESHITKQNMTRTQYGMCNIYMKGKSNMFRNRVCEKWEQSTKEEAGFPIDWYRSVYCINITKGYFERYVIEVFGNNLEEAQRWLERNKKQINDISVNNLQNNKKESVKQRLYKTLQLGSEIKDKFFSSAPRCVILYDELLTVYDWICYKEIANIEPGGVAYGKFLDLEDGVTAYSELYNKLLDLTVKLNNEEEQYEKLI